ncbi:MAG: DUF421 domain-containing protein [Alphaproteobacteria bacterium]|nr:DUF421 domain-containing protein [Alphaproteobacteria bacterium]
MHAYLITYVVMVIKLIMAIVAAVVFMHFFNASGSLKQMTPLTVIINFLLSAILSDFILSRNVDIVEFIVVVLIYGVLISILNQVTFSTNIGRRIFIGSPQVIIKSGKINTEKMEKLKISARDLAIAMRQNKIHSIKEIEMAQIEANGDLTIIKKGDKQYSVILVDNGIIDESALQKINRSDKWLKHELRENKIKNPEDVFLAQWYRGKLYVVKKNTEEK